MYTSKVSGIINITGIEQQEHAFLFLEFSEFWDINSFSFIWMRFCVVIKRSESLRGKWSMCL